MTADLIHLSIRLFRVPASARSDKEMLALLRGAAQIWVQADIELALRGAVTTLPHDRTRRLTDVLDDDDGGSPAGFAIPARPLGGSNGQANPGTRRLVVADATSVPAERVFGHELGHILEPDIGPSLLP